MVDDDHGDGALLLHQLQPELAHDALGCEGATRVDLKGRRVIPGRRRSIRDGMPRSNQMCDTGVARSM